VCLHCRYDLTGNTSGICPECGRPIPEEQAEMLAAGSAGNSTDPAETPASRHDKRAD
jgi:RNA polymerase-binding transcription factor DksA